MKLIHSVCVERNLILTNIIPTTKVIVCKQFLRQLAGRNRVTLIWLPAHKKIKGNVEAGILAKEGDNTSFPRSKTPL